jgi:hypothetical protein
MSFPPVSGQTSYNYLMNVAASAGQIYDIGFNNVLSPVSAVENIPVGLGTAKVIGADMQVRLPHQDIVAVQASTSLVSGNSTIVTLNGIALSPVVYATSNAATLTAIAALIAAQPFIASAVSNGTDTITITAQQGFPVSATFATTGGAGQPTWTDTYSNDNVFYGVALYIQNKQNLLGPQGSAGASPYYPGDPVPVMTRGRVWVTVENTVTSDSPVYWRYIPTLSNPQVGGFRSDSDGGNALLIPSTQVRWIIGATAGNLAVLDINQP